ncbi:hypothetical protein Tco_0853533 [Tanacetum coccineum]
MSGKRRSCGKAPIAKDIERSTKSKWEISKPKQILVEVREKVIAFFQNPKKVHKKSDFQWTPEAEQAFREMKQQIPKLPILTAPKPKEILIMYLSATRKAVTPPKMGRSGICFRERYFIIPLLKS